MRLLEVSSKNEIDTTSKAANLAVAIRRKLADSVSAHPYLVEKGWRCIVHIGEAMNADFFCETESDIGGGNWAEAKLRTMLDIPSFYPITKPMTLTELERALNHISKNRDEAECRLIQNILTDIGEFEKPDEATAEMLSLEDQENLRVIGLAPWYGGISVGLKASTDSNVYENRVAVAFSGATGEQDVFMAIHVLMQIVKSLPSLYPNAIFEWDFSDLESDPATKLWVDLYNIR